MQPDARSTEERGQPEREAVATRRTSTPKARPRAGRDRKQDIIDALYRCMARKGYAASTLSDVAGEAGMSSSHLLYYFPGKEAILEAFFREVSAEAKAQVEGLPEAPEARLVALANALMPAEKGDKQRRAVMLDLHGQSVQNRVLRRLKAANDRFLRKELSNIFKKLPRSKGLDAEAASRSAFAMLQGLQTTSFFDSGLAPEEANRLFRLALHRIGGLPDAKAPRKPRRKTGKA